MSGPLPYGKRPVTRLQSIVMVACAALVTALLVAVLSSGSSSSILLGYSTITATHDTGAYPGSEAFRYVATADGTAGSINVYLDSTDGASVGLYTSVNYHPTTLLARGSVASNLAGWVSIPLSSNPTVHTARGYWIAVGAAKAGGTVSFRDTSGGGWLDYAGTGFANPYLRTSHQNGNPASAYVVAAGSTTSTTTSMSPPVNTGLPVITGLIGGFR